MNDFIGELLFNPIFVLLIAIVPGMAIGKIKIKNFSLGASGAIFSGIAVGWAVVAYAKTFSEEDTLYEQAENVISSGVISQTFQIFFLFIFIASIGLLVGSKTGIFLRKYGIKYAIIGFITPCAAMLITLICILVGPYILGSNYDGYKIAGVYSGAMTNSAAYGTSISKISEFVDIEEKYEDLTDEQKEIFLSMIDESGELSAENTTTITSNQADSFLKEAKTSVSMGYAITLPFGVIGIILAVTFIPVIFKIEDKEYETHEKDYLKHKKQKNLIESKDQVIITIMIMALVMALGMMLGSIVIDILNIGKFSIGSIGGIMIISLIFSYVLKVKFQFQFNMKLLLFLREFGLAFFMATAGLINGYNIVSSFSCEGLTLAIMALIVEFLAIIISFLIGRYILKLNWGMLSGAICGGCTSAVGLGAAINVIKNDEPTIGFAIAQPIGILTDLIVISIFHSIFFV